MAGKKNGFTLAETLIVLVVLGMVAIITVPSFIKRYHTYVIRAKIKKCMMVYDVVIQKMTIENDLRTGADLKWWANSDSKCTNVKSYFRKAGGYGCILVTSDRIYWDVSDITNPLISVSEEDMQKAKISGTDGKRSFRFVSTFDSKTGAFRTNELIFEQQRFKESLNYANEDTLNKIQNNIDELKKLYTLMLKEISTED